MQYTESNLGIPEARFEYLGLVARWLVAEWATAQGHPVDPYRPVYDRILARLAFLMHSQGCSEMERTTAERYIGEWLPLFGFGSESPSDILECIAGRTGILVRETRATIVFAQFGLQEYFASLEIIGAVGVAGLARLEPRDWWREVILLAVAQQREPTEILTELFGTARLMAAAAVAECPTPSVVMQRRAMKACLDALDNDEPAVGGALVPLLRRVRDDLERELCAALEERLSGAEARASVVGIALATAGTEVATGTLAKHPEVWDRCLKDAGFLSSSLENVLVDWITEGTDSQSLRAADMIATRLSADRLFQLVDTLPHLAPARAEHLAALILQNRRRVLRDAPGVSRWMDELTVVSRCAPFLQDIDGYLSQRLDEMLRATETAAESPLVTLEDCSNSADLVMIALHMLDCSGRRLDEKALRRHIARSVHWTADRSRHWLSLMSCLAVASLCLPGSVRLVVVLLLLAAGSFLTSADVWLPWVSGERDPALSPRYRVSREGGRSGAGLLLMVGTGAACVAFLREGSAVLSFVLGATAAVALIALGYTVRTNSEWYGRVRVVADFVLYGPQAHFCRFSRFGAAIFVFVLVGAFVSALVASNALADTRLAVLAATTAFAAWLVGGMFGLYRSRRMLGRARRLVQMRLYRLAHSKGEQRRMQTTARP
jgi:hypothetical protein